MTDTKMTLDQAIEFMKSRAEYRAIIEDSYLDDPVTRAAERFRQSPEFAATQALLGVSPANLVFLDLGAGRGVASYAWSKAGASNVLALEPDSSDIVGGGAISRLVADTHVGVKILRASGESIPLPAESVDVAYARQVLHHLHELSQVLKECARVLRPGGIIIACREHVVDDEKQLEQFLARHPVHQLAGGEHAHSLASYKEAFESAGFINIHCLGPWDSLINAYPTVRTEDELRELPALRLQERFGRVGKAISNVRWLDKYLWTRFKKPNPGRLYSFRAVKSPQR